MKFFENKKIFKHIILIFLIILILEFSIPINQSRASFGGVLFTPVQDLVLGIGDVMETVLNYCIYGETTGILTLSKTSFFDKVKNFGIGAAKFVLSPIWWLSSTVINYQINKETDFVDEIELPVVYISPDKMFANQVPLLDANIFNVKTYKNEEGEEIKTPAIILQGTISKWYIAIRNIAIVAFLSMLVYIGIRIIISSTAGDKAKYKQMLVDWIVGLCLLFTMHYIMSFAMLMTDKITDLVASANSGLKISSSDIKMSDFKIDEDDEKIVEKFNTDENGNESDTLNWSTDLMGYVRFNAQTNIKSYSTVQSAGFTIMYIVLVLYTYIFLFQYLKRLFNIVLLTLLAPAVAFSYPLDKIGDGQSQAFNFWLKEYMFNLVLQPIHLILYTVLIGGAIDLVASNPLYAIIVMAALLPAEKIIRKMFKVGGTQLIGDTASGMIKGAAIMGGLTAAGNAFKKRSNNTNNSKTNDNSKVRMASEKDNKEFSASNKEMDFQNSILGGSVSGDNQEMLTNGNEALENQSGLPDGGMGPENIPNIPNGGGNNGLYIPNNTMNNGNGLPEANEQNTNLTDSNIPNENNQGNIRMANLPDDGNNQNKGKGIRGKIGRVLKSEPMKFAGAQLRLSAPKMIKKGVRTGIKAVGATAGGLIGIGIAAASDKPENMLNYAVQGAGALSAITAGSMDKPLNKLGEVAQNRIENPNYFKELIEAKQDELAKERYKDDPKGYKEYQKEKENREFLRDKEVKQKYVEAFGQEQSDSMMQEAIKYRNHGVKDNDLIIKTMQQQSEYLGSNVSSDRRIVAAQLASNVKSDKDLKKLKGKLEARGVSKEEIKKQEETIKNIRADKLYY